MEHIEILIKICYNNKKEPNSGTSMNKLLLAPPFQTRYSIETDSEALAEKLKLNYGNYVTEQRSVEAVPIRILRNGLTYTFSAGLETWETDSPLGEIDRFRYHHTSYHADIIAFHGAAVEWRGKCFLFLASTTSGKTTLASYLTSHNCGYVTDDCILLGRSDFRVHPYPSPLHLRDGGVEVLRSCGALPPGLQLLEEPPSLRRWVYTPCNCIKAPLPVTTIYFIERTEHENALIPMSTTDRLTALMHAPLTDYPINGDYLRFLSRLAKTDCFRLCYCDMAYVKEMIQHGA